MMVDTIRMVAMAVVVFNLGFVMGAWWRSRGSK